MTMDRLGTYGFMFASAKDLAAKAITDSNDTRSLKLGFDS
jgi:hypothetical protein